jgi:hypothetical protein
MSLLKKEVIKEGFFPGLLVVLPLGQEIIRFIQTPSNLLLLNTPQVFMVSI